MDTRYEAYRVALDEADFDQAGPGAFCDAKFIKRVGDTPHEIDTPEPDRAIVNVNPKDDYWQFMAKGERSFEVEGEFFDGMGVDSLKKHLVAFYSPMGIQTMEQKLDWARLLAKAVLGGVISTYEVADQTLAIHGSKEMIWAAWTGYGEFDEESGLPQETPELRAKIEAAMKGKASVDDIQGMRTEIYNAAERAGVKVAGGWRIQLAALEAAASGRVDYDLK